MEIAEAIKQRRTIHIFSKAILPEEVIERIEQGFLWMPLMSELALMRTSFLSSMKQIKENSKSEGLKSDGKFY